MSVFYRVQVRTIDECGWERCRAMREFVEESGDLAYPYHSFDEAMSNIDKDMASYIQRLTELRRYHLGPEREIKWRISGAEFDMSDEGGFWFTLFWQPDPKSFVTLTEGRALVRRCIVPNT